MATTRLVPRMYHKYDGFVGDVGRFGGSLILTSTLVGLNEGHWAQIKAIVNTEVNLSLVNNP